MNREEKPESASRLSEPGGRRVSPGASPISLQPESARFIPAANTPRASVDLRIDELLLDGFSPADRYAIGETVERELTRLVTELGVPSALTHESEVTQLDGGILQIDPSCNAEIIGVRLARAIFGGSSK